MSTAEENLRDLIGSCKWLDAGNSAAHNYPACLKDTVWDIARKHAAFVTNKLDAEHSRMVRAAERVCELDKLDTLDELHGAINDLRAAIPGGLKDCPFCGAVAGDIVESYGEGTCVGCSEGCLPVSIPVADWNRRV